MRLCDNILISDYSINIFNFSANSINRSIKDKPTTLLDALPIYLRTKGVDSDCDLVLGEIPELKDEGFASVPGSADLNLIGVEAPSRRMSFLVEMETFYFKEGRVRIID